MNVKMPIYVPEIQVFGCKIKTSLSAEAKLVLCAFISTNPTQSCLKI